MSKINLQTIRKAFIILMYRIFVCSCWIYYNSISFYNLHYVLACQNFVKTNFLPLNYNGIQKR